MNGTIPDSLYNLSQLEILALSGHSFEGEIKTEIGRLKNLTQLLLNDNGFTGTLPSELGLCEELGKQNFLFGVHNILATFDVTKSIGLSFSCDSRS